MKQQSDKFVVITDSGQKYLVYEYTDFIDADTFQNPKATIHGLKEFQTFDGMAVNFIEEGSYMIEPLNVIARRIFA